MRVILLGMHSCEINHIICSVIYHFAFFSVNVQDQHLGKSGWGVVALEPLEKGVFVIMYVGEGSIQVH